MCLRHPTFAPADDIAEGRRAFKSLLCNIRANPPTLTFAPGASCGQAVALWALEGKLQSRSWALLHTHSHCTPPLHSFMHLHTLPHPTTALSCGCAPTPWGSCALQTGAASCYVALPFVGGEMKTAAEQMAAAYLKSLADEKLIGWIAPTCREYTPHSPSPRGTLHTPPARAVPVCLCV